MDPQVTWDELLRAYARQDWADVHEHATALSTWLARGGFPPKVFRDPPVADTFHCVLSRAACKFALAQAAEKGVPP